MIFKFLGQRIARLSPLLSLVFNKIFFPSLHCGILVELPLHGDFKVAKDVRIGASTRIYLEVNGRVVLGKKVNIGRDVHLQTHNGTIVVGNGTGIQDHCRLYGDVSIGRGCLFAPNIYVSSGTHAFDHVAHLPIQVQERQSPVDSQPVLIGDDCWIGANAVIMPGVEVGKGCVVGAGAVVTRNIPPYSIVVGAPARLVRKRFDFIAPSEIDARRDEDWPYFYSGFDYSELIQSNRTGLKVIGDFVLALSHPVASHLKLLVNAESGTIKVRCLDQLLSVNEGNAELVFNVPADQSKAERFEFWTSGVLRIIRANLV